MAAVMRGSSDRADVSGRMRGIHVRRDQMYACYSVEQIFFFGASAEYISPDRAEYPGEQSACGYLGHQPCIGIFHDLYADALSLSDITDGCMQYGFIDRFFRIGNLYRECGAGIRASFSGEQLQLDIPRGKAADGTGNVDRASGIVLGYDLFPSRILEKMSLDQKKFEFFRNFP